MTAMVPKYEYKPESFVLPDGRVLSWTNQITVLASGKRVQPYHRDDFRLDGERIDPDEGQRYLDENGYSG